jgi:type I restriction enzyme, R subunit
MNELHLQDKYLIPFITDNVNGLGYKEVKANTITTSLFIEEDLKQFLSESTLNKENYQKLLKKYKGNEEILIKEFIQELQLRIKDARNMALFFNINKSITFEGMKFYLFYPSESETYQNELFNQNIFSVVQELPYKYEYENKTLFSFRPDLTFFLNGIFLSYSELKSNFSGQNAGKNGRNKIQKDYREAVLEYLQIAKFNDISQNLRKDFLKIFEKAIHITATDLEETYIIRNIIDHFEDIKLFYQESEWSKFESVYKQKVFLSCKSYPISNESLPKQDKLKEIFTALYSKEMIEKEILYYNFIEREIIKGKRGSQAKNEKGRLISPRPKQKFGTDKIIKKINEFLEHEQEDDYFINKLKAELINFSPAKRKELIEKRLRYNNNKNVYSLLLQYAAGFGKSNIIGWTALQLKDLKKNGNYVYDKIMIVVDRIQLRDQLDRKMFNMNIDNKLYSEAKDKKTFKEALESDKRIIIVNLQKFNSIKTILDLNILKKLAEIRTVFLIDEIHRSHSGTQNEEMMNLFDELQGSFDNPEYAKKKKKKNLLIGFTATPSDHALARFGEFNKYAESEKIWIPFDSYTMREAIENRYILNPLLNLVPVSAKMFYELPEDKTKGVSEEKKEYKLNEKKKIYENEDRIDAISNFVVKRLVEDVYKRIRGTAKAMLAVYSIKSAIKYKEKIDKYYSEIIKEPRYKRFADAPIYIIYSGDGQDNFKSSKLNNGLTEEKVLQNFAFAKNGLIIVVDKLQTGFDEPKLHTLFLDKEIRDINAIQTISRVNRTTKYKDNCKIIDFSHKNVNINNIKSAFEYFSDVVVSDFDPLNELKLFEELYERLIKSELYMKHFKFYSEKIYGNTSSIEEVLELEEQFSKFIKTNPKQSKSLKKEVNRYFHILNLIQFVIDFEDKYKDKIFLEFWKKYNNEYNTLNKKDEVKDEVEIYFDDQIGIIDTPEYKEPKKRSLILKETESEYGSTKYRYDILKVLEKKNKEEEVIGQSIEDFELKIDGFFNYVKESREGRILITKINSIGTKFTEEEIISDFEKIYKKFIRRHRSELGEFFIAQTKDIIEYLYSDFEKEIKENLLYYY